MRKKLHKLLSFALASCMVLGSFSLGVHAEGDVENFGTKIIDLTEDDGETYFYGERDVKAYGNTAFLMAEGMEGVKPIITRKSASSSVYEYDLDHDGKYDVSEHTDLSSNKMTFYILDTCSIKGIVTLKLSDDAKKLISTWVGKGEFLYYEELVFRFPGGDYNQGTFNVDVRLGDAYVPLTETDEQTAYTYNAIAFMWPEVFRLKERKKLKGESKSVDGKTVTYFDLDLDNTFDVSVYSYTLDDGGAIAVFSKLDTCSCKGTKVIELGPSGKEYAIRKSIAYHTAWRFVLADEEVKPEPQPETKPEETKPVEETQKKVEETAPVTEVTVNNATYKVDGETAVLDNAKSATGSFSVPATVQIGEKQYPVSKIKNGAFKGSKITSLKIGKGITEIGNSAFEGCASLKSVTIGADVTKIGKKAFYNCKKLKSVTVKSKKLKSVGSNAFKKIKKNATIKVPKNKLANYKKLLKKKIESSAKVKK